MYEKEAKLNVGKSKVMVFERREAEVVPFSIPYRMSMSVVRRCEVLLKAEKWSK